MFVIAPAHTREDMRRWFLSLETELLRVRFITLRHKDRDTFFEHYKQDFNFTIWSSSFTDESSDNKKVKR